MNENNNKPTVKLKVLKYFLVFMFAMFVMTFISRDIYSSKLPMVTSVAVKNSTLGHDVKCNGTIKSSKEMPVYTLADLRIAEVCVKNGDIVNEGDVLMRLDKDYLQNYINTLAADIETDRLNREDYYKAEAWNSAKILTNSMEQKQSVLDRYQALLDSDAVVTSSISAMVSQVKSQPGDLTADTACIILSDLTQGLYFSTDITSDEYKLLSGVKSVTLTFNNGFDMMENCEITSVVKNDTEDSYNLKAALTDPPAGIGDLGTLMVTVMSTMKYDCFPLEAVYESGPAHYVYLLKTKEGFLGEEYTVIKKSISVDDKNDKYAGSENSGITSDDIVVMCSGKELTDGQVVRYLSK